MTADHPDRGASESGVPVAHGRHRARGDLSETLPARKAGCGRLRLHHSPERILGQILDAASGPLAVVALGQSFVDVPLRGASGGALRGEDRFSGLHTPLHRAGYNGGERQHGDLTCDRAGLGPAAIVEMQTRGTSGQHPPGQLGEPVTHEQYGGHTSLAGH